MDQDNAKRLGATQSADSVYREWLHRHNLHDTTAGDFALTPRSRRLRSRGTEGDDDPKLRLLVTALAIPKPPWRDLWAASDVSIYSWLKDKARRYEPFGTSVNLPAEPKAMHGGVSMVESDHRTVRYSRRYIALERAGIVELGLGVDACVLHNDEKTFLFTPIVADVWHMLGLASDLYARFQQTQPFTLLVNMRDTSDALLGGLAEGWRGPWGTDGFKRACAEPNIQICHDNLGPALAAEEARKVVTEVAFEIEAAWGMGGLDFHPRCFKRQEDGMRGEFDLSAIR